MEIIDAHHHLESELLSLPGLVASMDAAGISKTALIPSLSPPLFMPSFAPLLLPFFRGLIHAENKSLHRAGLALYENTVKADGTVDLLGKRYRVKTQPRNDEVLEAAQRFPGRILGWVFVNPAGPVDPVEEVERCMAVSGMIGVKAHPFWHNYEVSLLKDTAALCEEKGWPMLIHLGSGPNGDFRLLPETFPKLKVLYAHAGIPYSPELCAYARKRANVFVDLSSSAYVDLKTARKAVKLAGPEKCLFGTDGPYFHLKDDRFDFPRFLKMIDRLRLSNSEQEKVLGKNFLALSGLEC